MQLNIKPQTLYTHEGAVAKHISPLAALRRSVMSCLLWEREFYEDGKSIAKRIEDLAKQVSKEDLVSVAIEAKFVAKLRHTPLYLASLLAENHGGKEVSKLITRVIRRADEIPELVSIYWRNGKRPLTKQLKVGLANAFNNFDEYQFAKYDRDTTVKLRDVMFLVHPRPKNEDQGKILDRIADRTLATPDTWEVGLSAGEDKAEVFTRLLHQKKLGYLALLRNLRNMHDAGVSINLIKEAIGERKGADNVLPFRYLAALRAAPVFYPDLDSALRASLKDAPELKGNTVVLVDVSYSMSSKLSAKSDLTRMDAATLLGAVLMSEGKRVFSFSNRLVEVPAIPGLAGADAISRSQPHQGTDLGSAVRYVIDNVPHDRLVVITDEQSQSRVPDPIAKSYMINVASYKNGVGYGAWTHINGFSENVIRFISEYEQTG